MLMVNSNGWRKLHQRRAAFARSPRSAARLPNVAVVESEDGITVVASFYGVAKVRSMVSWPPCYTFVEGGNVFAGHRRHSRDRRERRR